VSDDRPAPHDLGRRAHEQPAENIEVAKEAQRRLIVTPDLFDLNPGLARGGSDRVP
jgi:hypothetical protein